MAAAAATAVAAASAASSSAASAAAALAAAIGIRKKGEEEFSGKKELDIVLTLGRLCCPDRSIVLPFQRPKIVDPSLSAQ